MAIRNIRHRLKDIAPPRLKTTFGFRVLYTIAVVADATIELALQGTLARFPGVGTATALSTIGRDRLIPRGQSESDDAYAARLVAWRDAHRRAGSAYLELEQIQAYHYEAFLLRLINSHSCWMTVAADGTRTRVLASPENWSWDGQETALPSRFWIVIYPPNSLWQKLNTLGDVNNPNLGDADNPTLGCAATAEEVADIQGLVEHWRSAGALCEHIIISFDSADFDPADAAPPNPDGTWGSYSKLDSDGNVVPARNTNAIYWLGTSS